MTEDHFAVRNLVPEIAAELSSAAVDFASSGNRAAFIARMRKVLPFWLDEDGWETLIENVPAWEIELFPGNGDSTKSFVPIFGKVLDEAASLADGELGSRDSLLAPGMPGKVAETIKSILRTPPSRIRWDPVKGVFPEGFKEFFPDEGFVSAKAVPLSLVLAEADCPDFSLFSGYAKRAVPVIDITSTRNLVLAVLFGRALFHAIAARDTAARIASATDLEDKSDFMDAAMFQVMAMAHCIREIEKRGDSLSPGLRKAWPDIDWTRLSRVSLVFMDVENRASALQDIVTKEVPKVIGMVTDLMDISPQFADQVARERESFLQAKERDIAVFLDGFPAGDDAGCASASKPR